MTREYAHGEKKKKRSVGVLSVRGGREREEDEMASKNFKGMGRSLGADRPSGAFSISLWKKEKKRMTGTQTRRLKWEERKIDDFHIK